jgi:transitional endoplasmic reticulum ATPase
MVKGKKGNFIELKVVEALQDDVYKGVARMDPNLMRNLGLQRGDVISIKGQRETFAIVDRAYPADVGEEIIRVDGLIRRNARTGVGENVQVRRAELRPASKVVIAPAQHGITVQGDPEMFKNGLLGRPVNKGDIISLGGTQRRKDLMSEGFPDLFGDLQDLFGGNMGLGSFQQLRFVVASTSPKQPGFINENTEVVLNSKSVDVSEEAIPEVTYEDIGGLSKEVKKIRDIFEEADKNAPTIIFIDEIDAIAPKREEVQGEVERRVVSQLLTMMDGLKSRGRVIVIAATNRVNSVDPALRRPGRFDREVEISVPDKEGRLNILKIHTRSMPLKNVDLKALAAKTHGFVGADISALTKEAAMNVLRKFLPELKLEEDEPIPPEVLDKIVITMKDFEDSLKVVRPSAMREVLVETPNVGWNDIGGLERTKEDLKEAVEWPLKYGEAFKTLGIHAPRGVLLYGPPGTGKTLLAKAVAKESESNFIQVKGPSLLSMWVGKSEEGVRKIFERARQVAPCVVFFDEIDAMAGRRGQETGTKVTERVLNQLLAEMDGLEDLKDITIVGATNRPDMLDPALLRPGRFDRVILVDVPDEKAREEILKVHLKNTPLAKDVSVSKLARLTAGYVGADIENLVREAAMHALRKDINSKMVSRKDFDEAMKRIKPSVSEETANHYKKIEEHYLKSAKAGTPLGPMYTG